MRCLHGSPCDLVLKSLWSWDTSCASWASSPGKQALPALQSSDVSVSSSAFGIWRKQKGFTKAMNVKGLWRKQIWPSLAD